MTWKDDQAHSPHKCALEMSLTPDRQTRYNAVINNAFALMGNEAGQCDAQQAKQPATQLLLLL